MHLFFEPSFGSSPPLILIPSFVLSIVMLLIDAVVVSLIPRILIFPCPITAGACHLYP